MKKAYNFTVGKKVFLKEEYTVKDHNPRDRGVVLEDKEGFITMCDKTDVYEEDACATCGINEFENPWVCRLIYNHIENP